MEYCSIEDLVESYKQYLLVKYKSHHERFGRLCLDNPDGAAAEAAVFSYLRTLDYSASVSEDISTGGVDFMAEGPYGSFLIEVTSLNQDSIARASGWDKVIPEGISVASYRPITNLLRTKASKKAEQVSGIAMPRLLAICTAHHAGNILLGPDAAVSMLVGDSFIQVPVGEHEGPMKAVTDLKNSVFFRFKDGQIEECRQSISAVVLITLFKEGARLIGVLNPCCRIPFKIEMLSAVPFARLVDWPPEDGILRTEWVMSEVSALSYRYAKVDFKNAELRA